MKQLLIVNSAAALNGGASTPKDISGMTKGSIGVYALNAPTAWLAAKPTSDFAIVLGNGSDIPAFVIPEVDVSTLTTSVASPADGVKYKAEVTIPATKSGLTYTLVLSKKGVVFNERSNYSATVFIPTGKEIAAASIAKSLGDTFKAMADNGTIDVNVTISGAKIIIEAKNIGNTYSLSVGDDLVGTSITETQGKNAVGDKAYIQDLASRCAAGKGYYSVYQDGDSIYPGYPEAVEDKKYTVFNLRFANGRKFGKQVDERVYQMVHIAVPEGSPALTTLNTMFGKATTSDSGESGKG